MMSDIENEKSVGKISEIEPKKIEVEVDIIDMNVDDINESNERRRISNREAAAKYRKAKRLDKINDHNNNDINEAKERRRISHREAVAKYKKRKCENKNNMNMNNDNDNDVHQIKKLLVLNNNDVVNNNRLTEHFNEININDNNNVTVLWHENYDRKNKNEKSEIFFLKCLVVRMNLYCVVIVR
jgi:hypothetical protein